MKLVVGKLKYYFNWLHLYWKRSINFSHRHTWQLYRPLGGHSYVIVSAKTPKFVTWVESRDSLSLTGISMPERTLIIDDLSEAKRVLKYFRHFLFELLRKKSEKISKNRRFLKRLMKK